MSPKYMQVKEKIKSAILRGTILPHQKIGPENELMAQFKVSRHTVRQAINELMNDGWVYRIKGKGTFCAERSTAERKEKAIGIITTYISYYIFPSIINGIESYVSQKGYSIYLANTNNSIEKERACLENMLNKNMSGILVWPTRDAKYNPNLEHYLHLESNHVPYVMIDGQYAELEPPRVTLDDEAGGYMATKHLIELGHRHIIGIFKNDTSTGINRMKGYIRAHREHHIPLQAERMITISTDEDANQPHAHVRKLLQSPASSPTAIVAYNDETALNILDVIRELHLRVPEDISIVGYDDSHLATAAEVKLTTIKHPKEKMGEKAAQLLIDAIEHKEKHPYIEPVSFQPELVQRQSTAAL